jgi:beta-lactam-binding protein with PASTA domain
MQKVTEGMEVVEFPDYVPPLPSPSPSPTPSPTPSETPGDKVMVPWGLTGKPIAEVMGALSANGLTPVVVQVESDQEQGIVLSVQHEGQEVPRNTSIRVEVSTGPAEETVNVPGGLVGGDENNARRELQKVGLNPVVQSQTSSDFAEGMVIDVNPDEGASVPAGSDVQVIVSSGPGDIFPSPTPTDSTGPGPGNGNG